MATNKEYQAALDYLYSYVDYSVKRSYRYSEEVFKLDRVRELLHQLGEPQKSFASIHVAGTKGKGSVSALCESALRAAGLRTGLYTSPHLIRFTERIRMGGEEITEEEVIQLVERIKPIIERIPSLTVFEIITSMAFLYFAQRKVECAVIEVGLGGRLDATNVLHPLVTVITSLSYDHMHLLGNSLSDIAREKAGILKPGIPLVLAPQQIEAEQVVVGMAEELDIPIIRVGEDWLFSPGGRDLDGQTVYIWSAEEQALMDAYVESAGSDEWVPPRYFIPLLGYHQVINCAVAYAVLRVVGENGVEVTEADILEGFRNVTWPGRFQVLSRNPIIVIDAAHNRDSALKLRIALEDYFSGQPVRLIFGASADKDISGMLAELIPRVSSFIATQSLHKRAEDPEMIAQIAHSYGISVEVITPVASALNYAWENVRPDEVILITGSLFVIGEAMDAWNSTPTSKSLKKELEGDE